MLPCDKGVTMTSCFAENDWYGPLAFQTAIVKGQFTKMTIWEFCFHPQYNGGDCLSTENEKLNRHEKTTLDKSYTSPATVFIGTTFYGRQCVLGDYSSSWDMFVEEHLAVEYFKCNFVYVIV